MKKEIKLLMIGSALLITPNLFAEGEDSETQDYNHIIQVNPNFDFSNALVSDEFGVGFSYEKISKDSKNLLIGVNTAVINRSEDEVEDLRKDTNDLITKKRQVNSILVGVRSKSISDQWQWDIRTGVLRSKGTYESRGVEVSEDSMAIPFVLGIGKRWFFENGLTINAGGKLDLFESNLYREISSKGEASEEEEKNARDLVRKEGLEISNSFFQFGVGYAF